jgi:hypothetical protein
VDEPVLTREDIERLEVILPSMLESQINERTRWVAESYWLKHKTVEDIAQEKRWACSTVEWHLYRAFRAVQET